MSNPETHAGPTIRQSRPAVSAADKDREDGWVRARAGDGRFLRDGLPEVAESALRLSDRLVDDPASAFRASRAP